MGHSRPLFLYFRLFKTADSKQMLDKSLPMPGFELQISGFKATSLPLSHNHCQRVCLKLCEHFFNCVVYFKMSHPWPLFRLIKPVRSFLNKFYFKSQCEEFYSVYGAEIQTHDLQNGSLLP